MKEFQRVRRFESFALLGIFFVSSIMAYSVFSSYFTQKESTEALRSAEKLAVQLMSGGIKGVFSERRLSSVEVAKETPNLLGKISQDPWGRPFSYRFIQSDTGGKSLVVVWSNGPNQKKDTTESQFGLISDKKNISFGGDDLGVVMEVNPGQR